MRNLYAVGLILGFVGALLLAYGVSETFATVTTTGIVNVNSVDWLSVGIGFVTSLVAGFIVNLSMRDRSRKGRRR